MHSISKAFFGAVFVLSPLSAAMAEDAYQLPVITNTVANLVEQDSQKTLAAVTVIDRAEIERKQFHSVEELLSTLPGVSMKNNGGAGKATSISLRGTNANAVLVLVDGQKIGSATTGQTAFQFLPIDQIERIEVVRGPRSSLYGSEAIGGVIKIFTRKDSENGVKPFASLTYGSHETYDANAGINIKTDKSWTTLSVAGAHTKGIDATDMRTEPDRDGYKNYSVLINTGYQFTERLAVDANLLHVDGTTEYDNSYSINPEQKIQQNIYGLGAVYDVNNLWKTQLKIGRAEDKEDTRSDKKSQSVYNTARDSLSWLNTLNFNENNTLLLGYDYLNDEIKGSGVKSYVNNARDNHGYFAQYLGNFSQVELQTALRVDDNEQFGTHTTGNATLGYHFDQVLTYISYGTAFKAPTFNDLYSPYGGVLNLKPEQSENYEIGLKGQLTTFDWELNGFYNEIDDLIVWRPDAPGSYSWYASQIDKARIRGVELSLGQTLQNWKWNVNYTYQDPENRSEGAAKGKQISYRAKQLFNASADYTMDKWTVGGSVHAEDKRFVDTDGLNTSSLPSFATADTRVTYQATPEFSVQAKLANMFDKQYQTSEGYNQDGRTAWVTLRYAMK